MKSWQWGDVIREGGTNASTYVFKAIIARWTKERRPIMSSGTSDFKNTKSSVLGMNFVDFWLRSSC